MKTILFLDSCIKSSNFNPIRLKQYIHGYISIFKHIKFFKENNIDILLVDNSVSSVDELPEELRNLIPNSIKIIVGKNNKFGMVSNTAGCFEHWRMGREIWKDYDYIINFELRQTLKNLKFFEEFIAEPISMFAWCGGRTLNRPSNTFPLGIFTKKDKRFNLEAYGVDNSNFKDKDFNDFYTGLFSCKIEEFTELVNNIDLSDIVYRVPGLGMMALEKIMMNFAYHNLDIFKMIAELNVLRYSNYCNLSGIQFW